MKHLTSAPNRAITKAIDEGDLDPQVWDALTVKLATELTDVYRGAQADVAAAGIDFNVPDQHAIHYGQARAAELVTNITTNMMARLRAVIVQGLKDGLSPDAMKQAILDDFAFSVARAKLIARTEMAMSYNAGQLSALKESPSAAVTVLDGLSGDSDYACRTVDGMTISLLLAQQHLIQHPNCVRAFSPAIPEVEGDTVQLDDADFLAAIAVKG